MDAWTVFFETPAWLAGQLVAIGLISVLVIGAPFVGYHAGRWINDMLRVPFIGAAIAILIGIYITLVLYRSSTWTAVAILHWTHQRDR
ncbi:hypothetical protein [Rhizobium sp. SGZ-381]|uniref:hypothetical protein n=1 Tax=Rhizobium sp. SGZ-381 TaxID=3342800 RepID=UPI003671B0B3